MINRKLLVTSAVFFCTTGWVYSSSALGADESAPEVPATQATESAQVGSAGVFADATPEKATADQATAAAISDANAGQAVHVSTFGKIDLHVKDLDLTKVLQLLSIQSQRNLVASRNVAGTITADLYDVDFYEALDAVLHTNGFGYREKGNFIYVYTADELRTIEDAERKVTHQVYRLNYLTATDASTFVSPLLSAVGKIAISGDVGQGFVPSESDGGAKSFANTDTLVITDYPENVDEVIKLLKELDVRPKQALVEATVLKADLDEGNSFGVDMTILADFAANSFTNPFNAVTDLATAAAGVKGDQGAAFQTTPGLTQSGTSTAKIGFVTNSVAAFIKALDAVTDTTVVAKPKLLVLNRQKAQILVGDKIGYISTTTSDTSTTQSVEFLDTGTQLSVRPFISDDDMIRLELRPSVSSGETNLVGDFVIPSETTQELTTNIMIESGQTVVLGGLFSDSTIVSRRQVPGLGDLPLVGVAFKGQDDTVKRTETIFLVTTTIMKDHALYAKGEKASESVERAVAGAREGLLPFSRTKLVRAHMKDAMKYYESGDKDKALWCLNMALSLDPAYEEGQALREKLTGEKIYWPNRSILNHTADNLIQQHLDSGEHTQATPADETEAQVSEADAPAVTPATEDAATTPAPAEQTAGATGDTASDAQATAQATGDEPATQVTEEQPQAQAQDDASQQVLDAVEENAAAQAPESAASANDAAASADESAQATDGSQNTATESASTQQTDTQPSQDAAVLVDDSPGETQ